MSTQRGAIYARYSSDNQREESIAAQIYEITEYAKKNNITIVKTYTDEARSATTDDRPSFLRMIDDAKKGLFDVVLVHKLDRFARNRYDSAIYKRELRKAGVKLISITEKIDDSPEAIILESVLEGIAEYYSKNLAREAMKGLKENARHCKHNGGRPPLGLDVDPETKQYIPSKNQKEIEAVRLIFERYDQGWGYNKIIEELKLKGYKTKLGRDFSKNSLYEILRNEKYIGTYIYNRSASKSESGKRNNHKSKPEEEIIRIENAFPAIIDKDLFWRVQAKMDKRKHSPGRNKAKVNYLLSGLIYCGECGGAMVGNSGGYMTSKGRVQYNYYECNHRNRKNSCDNPRIRKEIVENFVLEELQNKIFNEKYIPELTQKINEYRLKMSAKNVAEINALKKELEETTTQINNLVDALAMGTVKISSIQDKLQSLENKKSGLEVRIAEIENKQKANEVTEEMIRNYLEQHRQQIEEKNIDACKKFIQKYVEKVIVYKDEIEVILFLDFDGGGGAYRLKSKKTKEEIKKAWNLAVVASS